MEEHLILCPVRGDVANVVRIRNLTLAGVDSAIICVDSCYGVRTDVRLIIVLGVPRVFQ